MVNTSHCASVDQPVPQASLLQRVRDETDRRRLRWLPHEELPHDPANRHAQDLHSREPA